MGDRPVRRPLINAAAALGLAVLGAATATCVVVLQPHWWGLALGVGATATALWVLPDRWWGRLPFGLGWAITVAVVLGGRAEGDYVLASDAGGYVVLATAVVVAVVGLVTLRPHRGRRRVDSGR